jgi:Ca2+-binding RTX toxin-like protein
VVTGTNGNVTVTGAPGGVSSVTLGNGNNVVEIGGKGDIITLGNGNNVVSGTQGLAFITTGSGNDTITLGGSGSTVNAKGGTNVIHGGTGNDTFVLPPASTGFDTITGFTETNGDLLNLVSALAATHWNGALGTLGNYLKVTDSSGSTTLSIAANGTGAGIGIATLSGAGNLGLADLLSHHSLVT